MADHSANAKPRRSLLFVPASRPDMFAKALASGADMVCADLEDAVAPALKAAARGAALAFLAGAGEPGPERAVRFNPLRTAEGARDLAYLADAAPINGGVLVLAKVADGEEIRIVDDLLTEHGSTVELLPLIESVRGVAAVEAIAAASRRNMALMFGAVDLSAELGIPVADEPLLYARSRTVLAARLANIGAFDVPNLDFRNLDLLRADAGRARNLGFTGKAMIHPGNAAIINECFTPTAAEVERARAMVAAFEASATGLVVMDGKLIERPVVRAMERVLARAASSQTAKA